MQEKREENKFKQNQHESRLQDLFHKWQELRISTRKDKVIEKRKKKQPKKLQELSLSTVAEISDFACQLNTQK